MREFHIDQIAERALASGNLAVSLPTEVCPADLELVKSRIMDIPFDCTPNWGISGIEPANNHIKRNWYTRDDRIRHRAEGRLSNVSFDTLQRLVTDATQDIVSSESRVVGIGLYGSYLYREATLPPEDLDVLVIAAGVGGIVFDALRYRHPGLLTAFRDKALPTPRTNDMGLTIISEEQFRPDNRSFLIADAAILDISTTFSHGQQVKAPELSPFIIAQNALKIIHWGLSSLPVKPISTMSRIDEALRMRTMLHACNPQIGLHPLNINNYLPEPAKMIAGPEEQELLELSKVVMRILEDDTRKIREHTADHLRIIQ